jgi:hypothetical protein
MAIYLRSFVYHFRRGRYVIPVQLAKEYGLKVASSPSCSLGFNLD